MAANNWRYAQYATWLVDDSAWNGPDCLSNFYALIRVNRSGLFGLQFMEPDGIKDYQFSLLADAQAWVDSKYQDWKREWAAFDFASEEQEVAA